MYISVGVFVILADGASVALLIEQIDPIFCILFSYIKIVPENILIHLNGPLSKGINLLYD